jgi:hypothetical protein
VAKTVSGTHAADAQTIAIITWADRIRSRWRRNVVTQSNWSDWLHQDFSRDIG